MPIKNWSVTPASNTAAPPFGAPESITKFKDWNDIMRQVMADTRYLAASNTVASAATTDLGAVDETFLTVSGVTTITSFGTVSSGIYKYVTFSGALTLTHNATSLILLGGVNRTTVAGDCGLYLSLGGGNWKEYFYSITGSSAYQPADPQLTTLAGISAQQATDLASLSTFIGTLLNDTSQAQSLTTLGAAMNGLSGKTAAYTVVSGDRGQVIVAQGAGSWTLSLSDAATLPAGFSFAVKNEGTGIVTIDPFGTQTIDAAATLPIYSGESFFVVNDGAGVWRTVGRIIGIGHSQTWAAATITSGTTYTNSTGKPIMIKADVIGNSGQRAYVSLTINGAAVGQLTDANAPSGVSTYTVGTVIIPIGATYVLTDNQVNTRTNYILS